jgi:dolichol-phosphate mannosyltransferase
MVHLLPRQEILELGAGAGAYTRQLVAVSRGENPITAVTFGDADVAHLEQFPTVAYRAINSLPGPLVQGTYDYVVGIDLLDEHNCPWLLSKIHSLLKPGGQIVLYETNPWNVVLRFRRLLGRLVGTGDSRRLINRTQLYELMSELGFVKVLALFTDFVYAPLNRPLIWMLRNFSILLENTPGFRTLAGTILIHGQVPGTSQGPAVGLCRSRKLRSQVSVVIPCHNEEMNVSPLVNRLTALYGDYLHEIILVDDNSQDGTAEALSKLAERNPLVRPIFRRPPNGVGRALADGYKAATGEYVLTMDCDFVHLLPEVRDLFEVADAGFDVAVGSRFSRHSVLLNYPIQKIVANRTFHLLAQLAFHKGFRDLTNNLKLLRREVVDSLTLTEPGFAVNAETGLQPLLMGFSVCETPISWINRTPEMGVSSFRLARVGGGYWRVLMRLAWKTRFGFRQLERQTAIQSGQVRQ